MTINLWVPFHLRFEDSQFMNCSFMHNKLLIKTLIDLILITLACVCLNPILLPSPTKDNHFYEIFLNSFLQTGVSSYSKLTGSCLYLSNCSYLSQWHAVTEPRLQIHTNSISQPTYFYTYMYKATELLYIYV